ncbi:hypothetical protein QJS10_CPA16g01142 [Acorus calamus]|uniref:Uncharacterized protein n=1 Tax=Acorus calamus TaxID=4465 RepID=A0AAV9D1K1_ACOCL|nr:hypothetical protein QJS10_CPA16g01142 [Acorus calamus]
MGKMRFLLSTPLYIDELGEMLDDCVLSSFNTEADDGSIEEWKDFMTRYRALETAAAMMRRVTKSARV